MTTAQPTQSISQSISPIAMIGYGVCGIGRIGERFVKVAGDYVMTSEGARSVAFLALSIIDTLQHYGKNVQKLRPLEASVDAFASSFPIFTIIPTIHSLISGDAYRDPEDKRPRFAFLAGAVTFLVYDVLGIMKYIESVSLIAKETGNITTRKLVGQDLMPTRMFIGFVGCSFFVVDTLSKIIRRGPSIAELLEITDNIGCMVGFAAPTTLPGAIGFGVSSIAHFSKFAWQRWGQS